MLAEGELLYAGQPVVVIAAESEAAIAEARRLIRLDIEPTEPILTIERAIELGRYLGPPRRIARGDAAGGAAADLSTSIMTRSMLHVDNAYWLEHVEIRGRVCFTNHSPATAFRGFGGPQAIAVTESIIQEIAIYLRGRGRQVRALDVQRRNLYGTTDRFTGDLTVPRLDLLIDIGRSINPGVDRGQVIGGFVQGMGWVTGECLVYDERGRLLSNSPTTYKIPAASDVPADFRCEFFAAPDTVANIAGSKAVGEPPLIHALCVWSTEAGSNSRRS